MLITVLYAPYILKLRMYAILHNFYINGDKIRPLQVLYIYILYKTNKKI
jgi:hypothetical protein